MAMMPLARTFENAASSVFLILPPRVAMTTYLPSLKSRVVSSARTFSFCSTGSRFTIALPRAFDATSGIGVHLQPVHPAAIGEHEHVRVRRGDEEVLDDVLFLRLHADAAFAAAVLRAIERQRRALDVAAARHGDDHVLVGDEVLDGDLVRVRDDLGAALVAVASL